MPLIPAQLAQAALNVTNTPVMAGTDETPASLWIKTANPAVNTKWKLPCSSLETTPRLCAWLRQVKTEAVLSVLACFSPRYPPALNFG